MLKKVVYVALLVSDQVLEFPWGSVARFQDPDGNRLQVREEASFGSEATQIGTTWTGASSGGPQRRHVRSNRSGFVWPHRRHVLDSSARGVAGAGGGAAASVGAASWAGG